ncbi:MAG: hypothetical protein OXN15_06460 [Chloroflexota bacterium]|nr:hypothetical protein [Chloroflexota bacterium]
MDHPKLEHGWLWEIFGSKIRSDVGIDDEFDETEDLPEPPPRQELVKPENVIDVPPPTDDDGGDFCIDIPSEPAEPLKNWKEVLEGLAYPTETVTITGQDITSVEGRELTAEGWRIVESAPEDSPAHTIEPDGGAIADGIQGELLNMAERLLERAGHSSQFKGRVYSILLQHIHVKFLDGASLRLADGPLLDGAWRMLSKVEERVGGTPGLVEGMVKYGDQ